jgi:hypothetical protein
MPVEEQIPASNFPPDQQGLSGQITPEQLEQIKARAREAAILQTYAQQQKPAVYEIGEPLPPGNYIPIPSIQPPAPKIVYVRRSLTVAEILLILLLSCGTVLGVQMGGNFVMNNFPRIEIKMK